MTAAGERCPDCLHFLDVHGPDGCIASFLVDSENGTCEIAVSCQCPRVGAQLSLEIDV